MAEYSFDASYIDGLQDNAFGVGAIVPGFAMGFVWNPTQFGGSGLRAQVYNDRGEIHEYNGITYDFEVPDSLIAGITKETVMTTPLALRFRMDSSSGNVWLKNPFQKDNVWWKFTLGQSLERFGHNRVGVGITSAAASFDNFTVIPMSSVENIFSSASVVEIPFHATASSGGPGGTSAATSERIAQVLFLKGFPVPTSEISIERSIFEQDENHVATWGTVDAVITSVLQGAGYKFKYVESENGFAIVTIDEYKCNTGKKVARWLSFTRKSVGAKIFELLGNEDSVTDVDLGELIRDIGEVGGPGDLAKFHWISLAARVVIPGLLKAIKPGCYRSMWFVTTHVDVGFSEEADLSLAGLEDLFAELANELSSDGAEREYSRSHRTCVLVYQYDANDEFRFINADHVQKVEARDHLMRSNMDGVLTPEQRILSEPTMCGRE